jgi:hypothetical protein
MATERQASTRLTDLITACLIKGLKALGKAYISPWSTLPDWYILDGEVSRRNVLDIESTLERQSNGNDLTAPPRRTRFERPWVREPLVSKTR